MKQCVVCYFEKKHLYELHAIEVLIYEMAEEYYIFPHAAVYDNMIDWDVSHILLITI